MVKQETCEELLKCKEDLELCQELYDSLMRKEASIQDIPFKRTDRLLSKKYFQRDNYLLEKKLYEFLDLDRELESEKIIIQNSANIYLPPIDNLEELKKYWEGLESLERKELAVEYLKLIALSHHFKIKQLIGSLFPLINARKLLTTILICRALFEHVASLNSYYELYCVLVKNNNLNPSFQKFKKGNITI